MLVKSKNSKARGRSSESDTARPFDPAMLDKARKIASDYEIVMWFEDGEWYGRGLELPHTYGDGKTPAACIASVRQGLVVTVATMLEDGERPPVPARTGERTEQVNIRLTASEKAMLENRSRAGGFRGVSDFVRASVLEKV
jgi:predicted RNase H-like HicB family nuclease